MVRVANALNHYSPPEFIEAVTEDEADLLILHVISPNYIDYKPDKPCIVVQYCLGPHKGPNWTDYEPNWSKLWNRALVVWSYYDLSDRIDAKKFYCAPLGVDSVFRRPLKSTHRPPTVLTTGTITGPDQEAIEEVWLAARKSGIKSIHFGPKSVAGTREKTNEFMGFLTNQELCDLYSRATWVACLRHIEGFELPAAEGRICGARPIVFDQPAMRKWYKDWAVYVPETSGPRLVKYLSDVMSAPRPVSRSERQEAIKQFDWVSICRKFWNKVEENL